MNKIRNFRNLVLFSLVAFTFSCQDLKENPAGVLAADSFFKTTADLDAAVTSTYRRLAQDSWGGLANTNGWTVMFGGDDICCERILELYQYESFTVSSTNTRMKASSWNIPYGCIFDANSVINNWERVSGDETFIKNRVAEAYFLRAWSYFWLVRVFGDVPMPLTIEVDLEIPLTSTADVYKLIVSDLEFAIANLPSQQSSFVGRPCQWTAKALLAQVYLTMAGWPTNDTGKYALAAKEAKDVIDSKQYMLLDDFKDLWLDSNDNNAEIVWSIQFCSMIDCGLPVRCTFIGLNAQPDEEGGWDQFYAENGFYDRYPDNYRKECTFLTEFFDRVFWEQSGRTETRYINYKNAKNPHPFYKKYVDGYCPWLETWRNDSDHMGGRDLNYLRYAEVLLIYAEAQCMADGNPNAMAYNCVNQVRKRANKGVAWDLAPGLDKTAFRDAIIDERGWEFAGEYVRWFDLVRTEKVGIMNTADKKGNRDPLPLSDPSNKANWFSPIPSTEVELNANLKK